MRDKRRDNYPLIFYVSNLKIGKQKAMIPTPLGTRIIAFYIVLLKSVKQNYFIFLKTVLSPPTV